MKYDNHKGTGKGRAEKDGSPALERVKEVRGNNVLIP